MSKEAVARSILLPDDPEDVGPRRPARPAGSMPSAEPSVKGGKKAAEPPARMVRHHEYEAIGPTGKGIDRFNWVRMCIVSFLCIMILTIGAYFFLAKTEPGQLWLASIGREASMSAYHTLGREYMVDGSISRAIRAFEIAQSKDPNNLEVLIDLGKAYLGNNKVDDAELAFTRAVQHWPAYSEPYRLIVDIMRDQGRNYEAAQLLQLAFTKTEDEFFSTQYDQMVPVMPSFERQKSNGDWEFARGIRYEAEFDIRMTCNEANGEKIFYITGKSDPVTQGIEYTGPIHLSEGVTRVSAVSMKDGMYSAPQVQTYTINKPTPDMPKSRLPSGTYDTVRTVALYAADNTTIYYTTDGTAPTDESKEYTEPFPLRIGKTTVRAIAVNVEGQTSNEFSIEYKCNGKVKAAMTEKDVFTDLTLYKTTQNRFVELHGTPLSEESDGKDKNGYPYTKLTYSFGYAVFVDRKGEKGPVLAELSTKDASFAAPRSTKVGSRMEDVLGAFQDGGGEVNTSGERILYNKTDGRLGMVTDLSEGKYHIGYYVRVENSVQWIELSYYIENGLVEHIEWRRYDTQ